MIQILLVPLHILITLMNKIKNNCMSHQTAAPSAPSFITHLGSSILLSFIYANSFRKKLFKLENRTPASLFLCCMKERERFVLLYKTLSHGSPNFLTWTVLQYPQTPPQAQTPTTTTTTETETSFLMGPNQEPLNLQTDRRVESAWPFKSGKWVLEARVILQLHMQLQRCGSWEHTCCA